MHYDALVIGGGCDGLIAAASLAKAGRKVCVLESRGMVGGRLQTREFLPGFKVSAGLHGTGGVHPELVRELGLERDGLELQPEDRGVTTIPADGAPFHFPSDPERARAAVSGLSEQDLRSYDRLRDRLERLEGILQAFLLLQPIPFERPPLLELWKPAMLALKFKRLGREDVEEVLRIGPQPLKDFLDDLFQSEILKATLALPGTLGTPLGPWSPGGAANLLLWEASSFAGRLRRGGLPKGGMGAQAQALAKSAERHGAEIRTGDRVTRLLREGERVVGAVLASDEELRAPCVISTVGPRTTFLKLLDPGASTPRLRQRLDGYRWRGSVAKVHFALGTSLQWPMGVEPGSRIQLGESLVELEKAHDDLKYGRASQRPVVDLAFPSLLDSSLAPTGKQVASAVVSYAPYEPRSGPWDDAGRTELGDRVQARIEEALPGFAAAVEGREVLTPSDIEQTLGIEGGHLLGGDIGLDQLFTNRPFSDCGAYRTPLLGLYLSGAATHPGGYPSGAAGANAARRVLRDWKELTS